MAIEAAGWRREEEHKLLLWQAWHIALLTRTRKLPSLESLLSPRSKPETEEEMEQKAAEFERMKKRWQETRRN
jgi:hypothetical protein